MLNAMYTKVDNVKKSKLLALFEALEDKDIIIAMTESLVEQYKNPGTRNSDIFQADELKYSRTVLLCKECVIFQNY